MQRTLLVSCFSALAALSLSQGPTDNYYLTAGQQNTNAIVNHLNSQLSAQAIGEEYPIAVASDVRTASSGQFTTPVQGAQYNLAFGYTGTNYNAFAYDPNQDNLFYDGTTDGTHNYVVSYGNSGEVYATDRSWGNLTPLFRAGSFGSNLGITYDPTNDSLWISNWGGTMITDYAMNGTALFAFSTGIFDMTSLGMDYGDGTLWFGSQGTEGTFYQYTRGGVFLQSQTYANLLGENTLGGEFNLPPSGTPEPFTLGLGALGIATAVRRRMRRS